MNSIRAHEARVLRWVDDMRPDVLALQEIMCDERSFPRAGFRSLGYDVVAYGQSGSGGVALVSRRPLHDVERGIPGAVRPFDEPRLISATVDGVRIMSVYAPNGRKVGTPPHQFKLAWFEFFRHVLAAEVEGDLVVLADLNIAPTDLDVWDAARYRQRNLTSPPERFAYRKLIEAGLVDVVRANNRDTPAFSWWNRRGDFYESDRGWRLDHVLASRTAAERVTSVVVDRAARAEPGPDHAPIVVEVAGHSTC